MDCCFSETTRPPSRRKGLELAAGHLAAVARVLQRERARDEGCERGGTSGQRRTGRQDPARARQRGPESPVANGTSADLPDRSCTSTFLEFKSVRGGLSAERLEHGGLQREPNVPPSVAVPTDAPSTMPHAYASHDQTSARLPESE